VPWEAPFTESSARAAIAQAICWSDALRALGYEPKGHNIRTLQRWARIWQVDTSHFDPNIGRRRAGVSQQRPLEEMLVEGSSCARDQLKRRLFQTGLKEPRCEMCGQGEVWRDRPMSMILDHINGVSNDNRLENLRIVCPNCAATLDTHCGRNIPRQRVCPSCGRTFAPRNIRHRYCSEDCWGVRAAELYGGLEHPETRKVPRPSHDQLLADLETMSFCAVGRKYGVSDNAIRKWLKWYARQREREANRGDTSRTDESAA
jgi:hypothetical protein